MGGGDEQDYSCDPTKGRHQPVDALRHDKCGLTDSQKTRKAMSGPCSWNNSRDLIHQVLCFLHSRICHTNPKGQAL